MFSLVGIQKTGNWNLTPRNLFLKNKDDVNVWQKPLQYCKVISLQLNKLKTETAMRNMLKTPMDKVNCMKEQMGNISKQRDGNSKKNQKRSARDQKHCDRNEECL